MDRRCDWTQLVLVDLAKSMAKPPSTFFSVLLVQKLTQSLKALLGCLGPGPCDCSLSYGHGTTVLPADFYGNIMVQNKGPGVIEARNLKSAFSERPRLLK